jgi:hypothetical protein
MTTPVLDAVQFVAPNVAPAVPGLYAVTNWPAPDASGADRFLHGVRIRGSNYGGAEAAGVWNTPWCDVPPLDQDERKEGMGRGTILDPFDPITVWGYDECDLTEPSRREVEANAAQILTLQEQPMVEREFAARLLEDAADTADGIESAPNLKEAVSYLEGQMALTNTVGFFHVGAQWVAQEVGLFIKSGTVRVSPSGHTWVIGGGYIDGLGNTIVATSQPFGWRDAPSTRTAIDAHNGIYAAVAERSVTIGYEAVIAAVTIAP